MSDDRPDLPPSEFAKMGQPCCSRWGKSEVEWLALAYVQALENGGDTWRPLSRDECHRLLTEKQRQDVHYALISEDEIDKFRFERVKLQLQNSAGAWGVGGFWSKHRWEMINGRSQ